MGVFYSYHPIIEQNYPFRCKEGESADYVAIISQGLPRPTYGSFELDLTGLLCKPLYSIRHVEVSLRENRLTPDSLASLAENLHDGNTRSLENLSTEDLYRAADPVSQIRLEQMNATFLKDFLVERFNATAAQLARLYFMKTSNESVIGEVTHDEERLIVREFPLVFMEVVLTLLSCVCIAIWFLSRQHLCPREPGSIDGLTTILARSSLMMSLFRGTSTTPLRKLEAASITTCYRTAAIDEEYGSHFTIVTSGEIEMNHLSPKDEGSRHSEWWRPIIVRTPSRVGMVFFTIGLIVALEVLNQYSLSHDGIIALQIGEYAEYAWVYIPTLVMVGVNVLYNMLDFAAVTFQPFTVLHNGGPFTEKVMLEDLAGKMAPAAIITCLSMRQITVPITKLAIIAGSMLSIAVSGLYTARTVVSNQPLPLVIRNDFQTNGPLVPLNKMDYHDLSIGSLPAILVLDHAPYPKWTYEEFAFPQLTFANNDTASFPGNSTTIHARIPALRGAMNCTVVDAEFDVKHGTNATGMEVGSYENAGYTISPKNTLPGCDLAVGIKSSYQKAYFETVSEYQRDDATCPLYEMYVGHLDYNDEETNISMAYCSPYIERTEVYVTFADTNFTIDTRHPPQGIPGTATVYARRRFLPKDSFWTLLDSGLSSYGSDMKKHGNNDNMNYFFNVLMNSGKVSSARDLMGPENVNRFLRDTS